MKRRYDVLYAIGALVSSPVLAFGLLRTGKWRTDWKGRFGKAPPLPDDPRPTLLLHGVSVGEINATRDLVARLASSMEPEVRVVVSATTNTGFDRAVDLYGDRHPVVRFPFDFSWMVERFLDRLRPQAVALMELEVWPNLAQACRNRGIPLVVINGRLSDSSFGTYRWARRWIRPMFRDLSAVAAQTEEYAQRFRELGVPPERVRVTDTMKWDTVRFVDHVEGASELGEAMGIDGDRPLVVAGSTGPGEEEMLLQARPPGVQLMLVPRKPERFDEVARLAPHMVRRTECSGMAEDSEMPSSGSGRAGPSETGSAAPPEGPGRPAERGKDAPSPDLFLLDTMGELSKAYALADVAVVGRSFVPLGGSDPIEPVALGKPTLIGPHHDNFRDVVSALARKGGLKVVEEPMAEVQRLLANPQEARAMAESGREVIRSRQGATERHARLLLSLLGDGTPEVVESRASAGAESGVNTKRRHPVRRALFFFLLLYLALGYLTTAIRQVPMVEGEDPMLPLPPPSGTLVAGVFSVHTGRSHDARGSQEQVAEAAAEAGLDFVVVGDHPPAPERPDWRLWDPVFLEGVLVDGGVELRGPRPGKVLAMGLDSVFRRWDGDMDSFVAFLERGEATSMIVHGRGPRGSERWEHDRIRGFDGWEVLDISESARARLGSIWGPYHLLTFLMGLPLGFGDEALLHLMREGFDTPAVAAYDSLRIRSPLTATAGLNVHPKLAMGPILVPSFGPFMRTLISHVVVDRPFPADAEEARRLLAQGIRGGNLFISMGNHPALEEFWSGVLLPSRHATPMGGEAFVADAGFLRAGFRGTGLEHTVYRIMRDGREVAWVLGPELEWPIQGPGHYRVEVYRYGARAGNVFFRLKPWIFANPVVVLMGRESEGA